MDTRRGAMKPLVNVSCATKKHKIGAANLLKVRLPTWRG